MRSAILKKYARLSLACMFPYKINSGKIDSRKKTCFFLTQIKNCYFFQHAIAVVLIADFLETIKWDEGLEREQYSYIHSHFLTKMNYRR